MPGFISKRAFCKKNNISTHFYHHWFKSHGQFLLLCIGKFDFLLKDDAVPLNGFCFCFFYQGERLIICLPRWCSIIFSWPRCTHVESAALSSRSASAQLRRREAFTDGWFWERQRSKKKITRWHKNKSNERILIWESWLLELLLALQLHPASIREAFGKQQTAPPYLTPLHTD